MQVKDPISFKREREREHYAYEELKNEETTYNELKFLKGLLSIWWGCGEEGVVLLNMYLINVKHRENNPINFRY